MKSIVYHGSPISNLQEIKKRKSSHGLECIYATDNETVALLFSARGNGDLDTYIAYENDQLYIVERRKDVFNNLYNRKGYIYELNGENFQHYEYLWKPEVISFKEEKICNVREISNILSELEKNENEGKIKIYYYPNRPSHIPHDNSDLIEQYVHFQENGISNTAVSQLLSVYPEFENSISKKKSL